MEKIMPTFHTIYFMISSESFCTFWIHFCPQCEAATLIFEEFIHDFCQRLLFADLHIRNDHTLTI